MDKPTPPDDRKWPKYAQFPNAPVRARMYASKLVAGAGVSGSSPLVGSVFCCDLQVKHKGWNEVLDRLLSFVQQPTTATRPLWLRSCLSAGAVVSGPSCAFLSSA